MRVSTSDGVGGSHWPPTGLPRLIGALLLAYVAASGIDSDGVADESVPDRVGMDTGAGTVAPVRLQTLTTYAKLPQLVVLLRPEGI